MWIPSREIPQANSFGKVINTIRAVGTGAVTFQEMAHAIGMGERQGRYYRLAAENLGFIERAGRNAYQLTPKGTEWLGADLDQQKATMIHAVLNATLFQRMLPFLESRTSSGCTRTEMESFIREVTPPSEGTTTIPRRRSTVVSWLKTVGLIREEDRSYYLQPLPEGISVVSFTSEAEPLVPTRFDLKDYAAPAARLAGRKGSVTYAVDQARIERANQSHQALVDLVAGRVRRAGAVPRNNGFVDLAATVSGQQFIFEMKSASKTNIRSQIRSGLSQLYEYRYLQAADQARLVLVVEEPLTSDLRWMVDYLIMDRDVALVWDGDLRSLHCDARQREEMAFLL